MNPPRYIKSLLKRLAYTPFIGRVLLLLFRFKSGLSYARRPVKYFVTWLFTSREYTNYTYDLDETNKRYLAAFVSHVAGIAYENALNYIKELEHDDELKKHIQSAIKISDEGRFADLDMHYGKRLGWYAIVRAVKPQIVVETGADKGLGSCVLTAALRRNEKEGHSGYYFGTDINPAAGYFLQGEYARFGKILYGDSIESLKSLNETIDVFINDSDHSAEYESMEYDTIQHELSENAIVIGDNAHVTDELLKFAERTNRQFLFFREQPSNHWYPGGGIGVAYGRGV